MLRELGEKGLQKTGEMREMEKKIREKITSLLCVFPFSFLCVVSCLPVWGPTSSLSCKIDVILAKDKKNTPHSVCVVIEREKKSMKPLMLSPQNRRANVSFLLFPLSLRCLPSLPSLFDSFRTFFLRSLDRKTRRWETIWDRFPLFPTVSVKTHSSRNRSFSSHHFYKDIKYSLALACSF